MLCWSEDPQLDSNELTSDSNCFASVAEDGSVVVDPKHSEMHPIWICVTLAVVCDDELGDGWVPSVVVDCIAVPATSTVTLS
ncbi:MAG TPA: hypothetical protein VMJ65_11965 [Solirubrobacteraceae bacterium]|nr:hypothetical protein [Solirubrobacteraceae bacterium]